MVETKEVEIGSRTVLVTADADEVAAEIVEPAVEFISAGGGSVTLKTMDNTSIERIESGSTNAFVVRYNDEQRHASSEFDGNRNSGEYDRDWKFDDMRPTDS